MAVSDTTTKIAILKHLASGKDLVQTAAFTRVTVEQARQVANAHGFPDPDKMRWAIDHLTESASTSDLTSKPAAVIPSPRVSAMSSHTPPATVTPLTKPDEIRVLLNTAKSHPAKRIQNAADRCFDAIDTLKRMIAEDEEKHAERRKAEAAKAAARAEVERLEAQLREAKARLGRKQGNKVSRPTAPKGEHPCRNDGCDRIFDTGQGRSMHERMKCPHRAEAASA